LGKCEKVDDNAGNAADDVTALNAYFGLENIFASFQP
jgi:hypothetical protein